jgi:hypothetical protein
MVRFRGFRLVTEILQVPVEEILAKVQRFAIDDATIVSPTGAVIIAEAACRAHSQTSPEWEHQWCREHVRPEHELPRQWCGHRAVAAHQRLTAAEAENHRLDLLVVQLTKALDLAGEPREPSSSLKNTNATGSTRPGPPRRRPPTALVPDARTRSPGTSASPPVPDRPRPARSDLRVEKTLRFPQWSAVYRGRRDQYRAVREFRHAVTVDDGSFAATEPVG